LVFTYTITFAVSYCIVAELVLMALTCLMPVAKLYKENYKFHNTTDTVLLTMFYGLLVSGSIVNTTAGSYYFKGTTLVLRLVTAGLPM